jgi:hypothetical protein
MQKCSICTRREGACIQCVKQSCFLAFHVTCALKSKLLFPMRSTQGSELRALACFCERHLPVCFSRPKHFGIDRSRDSKSERPIQWRRLPRPQSKTRQNHITMLGRGSRLATVQSHINHRKRRLWCLPSLSTARSSTLAGPIFERCMTLSF